MTTTLSASFFSPFEAYAQENTQLSATVTAFDDDPNSETAIQPRSAYGSTSAPGRIGAKITLYVDGNSTYVKRASITYTAGAVVDPSWPTLCGAQHEIAYYTPDGKRRTKAATAGCGQVTSRYHRDLN